jgi:hypothetical protein
MQEMVVEIVQNNPLFVASALASLVGISLYYLYRGFINENYQKIKWFRRLLLPHITIALRHLDEEYEEYDLSKLYVETESNKSEYVFSLKPYKTEAPQTLGKRLISNGFRPEVILTSLAKHPEGYPEVGNYVLSGPEKNHGSHGHGVWRELFNMFLSKWQLHVRYYFNEEDNEYLFYAHKEYNPYNPLYAAKHLRGEKIDVEEGGKLLLQYTDEFETFGEVETQ